jgi:ubiquinone/menaquinone biosynthesis C-methylase UbiE
MVAVEPHYVKDYNRLVTGLLKEHSLDEAMSRAVGGQYDAIGAAEADLLIRHGLREGDFLIDIGCGSGRLSSVLGCRLPGLRYLGTDIVPALLDFAKAKAPSNFEFLLHQKLTIPADDNSVDFIAFFSVFTHLLHEESYIYLRDAKRALRAGGTIVFSFLESAHRWDTFEWMVSLVGTDQKPHMNMFIERPMIEAWAEHIGLMLDLLPPSSGQSIAFMRKPQT